MQTIETKVEPTQEQAARSLDWGKEFRVNSERHGEPLTPEDWAADFGDWLVDFYTNEVNVPALRARADGEPDAVLEEAREAIGILYAVAFEPRRIAWGGEGVAELWELFLGQLTINWLAEWGASGRTLKDMQRAFGGV